MPTRIEWADETWPLTLGCTRVTKGCDGCYAIRTATVRAGNPHPAVAAAYEGLTHRTDAGLDWTGTVRLFPERLDMPLHWRKPRRIFVDSQSDLFHDQIPDQFIVEVFARMWWAPQHTFQILTKRHGRLRSLVPRIEAELRKREHDLALVGCPTPLTWPLPNVWLGVSVEDQAAADLRIPALLQTPAAVHWLSCEPLLGPVDLTRIPYRGDAPYVLDVLGRRYGTSTPSTPWSFGLAGLRGIDWVVVGGETGPRARPMHPDWARQLRDACQRAGVPYYFKQWGDWGLAPWKVERQPGETDTAYKSRAEKVGATHAYARWAHEHDHQLIEPTHRPWSPARTQLLGNAHAAIRKVGKKAAGRELDGRTWDEFPKVAA